MGAGFLPKGTVKIVRVIKDENKLREIARILEIPDAERDQVTSVEIHIVSSEVLNPKRGDKKK
jgi:hypothetical protein